MIHFFKIPYWENECTRETTDQEGETKISKVVFDNNNQEKENMYLFGRNLFQMFICVFVPTLFDFVDYL